MEHLLTEELVEGVEIDGVLLGTYRSQISLGMDGNVWVVTLVSEEWGHTGSCIWGVIVCELCKRQELGPIVLLVIAVNLQVLFQHLVHSLCLSVALRMITQGEMETDIKGLTKGTEEVGDKLGSPIGSDMGGNAVL